MSALKPCQFILSAPTMRKLPPDVGCEVAIIGRSNAGKSSALNTIFNQQLARVSRTPGRTQMMNVFRYGDDDHTRMVDLPGYGFAKVPAAMQARWQKEVNRYLAERASLLGLILVMDIRHPLRDKDQQLLNWTMAQDLPVHVLLTKTDKLSRQQARRTLEQVRAALSMMSHVSVQCFSSSKKTGIEEACDILAAWLNS